MVSHDTSLGIATLVRDQEWTPLSDGAAWRILLFTTGFLACFALVPEMMKGGKGEAIVRSHWWRRARRIVPAFLLGLVIAHGIGSLDEEQSLSEFHCLFPLMLPALRP
jgi:peptidoglycan/LPS O-acetylase OafA/YrhL